MLSPQYILPLSDELVVDLRADGEVIEAALTIDGLHADGEGAHLRWFIASGRARGSGVGGALMRRAMEYATGLGVTLAQRP